MQILSQHSPQIVPIPSFPQLGLVCITTSQTVRYKTLTRKRLLAMGPEEQVTALRSLYVENLRRFNQAIDFCQEQRIYLYSRLQVS